jgi:fused signal recognition particle receptor
MDLVYVLIALAALFAAYYLFFRKREPEQTAGAPPKSLSQKPTGGRSTRPPPPVRKPGAKKESSAPPATETPHPLDVPPPKPVTESVVPPSAPLRTPVPPRVNESIRPSQAPPAPSALERLRKGLSRSRSSEGFFGRLRSLFTGKPELNPELAAQIEEVLITSDVGVETTQAMLQRVRETLERGEGANPEKVWEALAAEARSLLEVSGKTGSIDTRHRPSVVLLVGVNGAGKTTTIGKLATKLHLAGHRCVLAAGDTFRAAAVQQLVVWGERVGCEVVRGKEGADPGSVVFDAIKKAEASGADVVLADTAGRLHTKTNLMAEMKKIAKTVDKAMPGAPHEILLVIDVTNGQNALAQAREFQEALPLTGIVLTKLDGTAKGGVVLGITHSLKLPVRFIGLGERPDDLHEFRPAEFVEALLGRDANSVAN